MRHPLDLTLNFEKEIIDNKEFYKSRWDQKLYPRHFKDYERINKIQRVRIQSENEKRLSGNINKL